MNGDSACDISTPVSDSRDTEREPDRGSLGRVVRPAISVLAGVAVGIAVLTTDDFARGWALPLARASLAAVGGHTVARAVASNAGRFAFAVATWRRFRLRMLVEVLGLLAVTSLAAASLGRAAPGLRWSWVGAWLGQPATPLLAPVVNGVMTPNPFAALVALAFLALLGVAIPHLASAEEQIFRKGATRLSEIVVRSIAFGLMHAIGGVPLNMALAISIPGFYFALRYRAALHANRDRGAAAADGEALLVSTSLHALFNTVIATAFAVVLAAVFLLETLRLLL